MTDREIKFAEEHRNEDVNDLLLHASNYPDVDMARVAAQIQGWQTAVQKLPSWAATDGIIYPVHLSMEQCSSELTAEYKGLLISFMVENDHPFFITDLTGGFGVDAVMMARKVENAFVTYVERNSALCDLARHNFPLMGVDDFDVIEGDCVEILDGLFLQDVIYIDPARRDEHGRKTYAIEDCAPDVCRLQDQLTEKATHVMIKLSPMLDISDVISKLKNLSELHVVSVEGECKELLALLTDDMEETPMICCVNIMGKGNKIGNFYFTRGEETQAVCEYAIRPQTFLYEPNASVMKAGAFKSVGCRCNVQKLHPNSHLYTSGILNTEFPGRKFEVVDVFSFQKQDIKRLTSSVKKANITVRNFPMSVADLRKRLKISEGGNDYLFATTLNDNSKALILCKKL